MVKEIQYTDIRRVLDNLTEHPMLADLTLEQVVRHTIRFISLHGYTKLYQDKEVLLDIHEYRALLPCDLISIIQVKDDCSGLCLRSMTDSFTPELITTSSRPLPPQHFGDASFKNQGRVLFTSFPEGKVKVAYKAIPVDDDGFPLLIDNENYLACLEAYIKKQVFTVKFDQGKIAAGILDNAKQDYAWLSGQLQSEFTIPSISEMQSITNYITSILPSMRSFDQGFKHLGSREYLRKHDNRR